MQSRLMPINSSLSAAPRWSWDGLIHACLCFSEEIFCRLQNSTQEGSSSFCQEKSLLKKRAQQSWEEQFPHGTVLRHGDKEERVTAGRRCLVCVWLADPQGKWKQKNLDQLQHECIGKNEWKHVVYESLRFCAQTLTLGRGQEKFTLTAPALAFSHLRLAHRLQTKCALPLAFVPARRNRTARRFEAPCTRLSAQEDTASRLVWGNVLMTCFPQAIPVLQLHTCSLLCFICLVGRAPQGWRRRPAKEGLESEVS